MSTKRTPIEPSEIRKGDTIRVEHPPGSILLASEYRATGDGQAWGEARTQHFLVERPEPTERVLDFVPDVETLGWLTITERDEPVLGVWRRNQWCPSHASDFVVTAMQMERDCAPSEVVDFQEAVAVPKAALDALALAYPPTGMPWADHEGVHAFLRIARGDR